MCALCINLVACVNNTLHCKVKGISDIVYKHLRLRVLSYSYEDWYLFSFNKTNKSLRIPTVGFYVRIYVTFSKHTHTLNGNLYFTVNMNKR